MSYSCLLYPLLLPVKILKKYPFEKAKKRFWGKKSAASVVLLRIVWIKGVKEKKKIVFADFFFKQPPCM